MLGRSVGHYRITEYLGGGSAAREYQRFLELWRKADPGQPELAEARSKAGVRAVS